MTDENSIAPVTNDLFGQPDYSTALKEAEQVNRHLKAKIKLLNDQAKADEAKCFHALSLLSEAWNWCRLPKLYHATDTLACRQWIEAIADLLELPLKKRQQTVTHTEHNNPKEDAA